jgi:predicted exporter
VAAREGCSAGVYPKLRWLDAGVFANRDGSLAGIVALLISFGAVSGLNLPRAAPLKA